MDRLVLSSQQITAKSPVGGKAYYLAKLLKAGFPVPALFFVTIKAFQLFIERNKLETVIADYFRFVKEKKRRESSLLRDKLRTRFAQAELCPELVDELKTALSYFGRMGIGKLAVRSSAQGEDAAHFSYAGLYDSILHVDAGLPALTDAVKQVWLSAFDHRVAAYAATSNLPDDWFQMGVIIQEMIDPQLSGVFFSSNPVTGDDKTALLEFVEGHMANLMQGEVTPHRLSFRRDGRVNLDSFGDDAEYGSLLPEVVRQCFAIEDLLKTNIDVEWAVCAERVYILQARPITGSLTEEIVWTDENVGEVIPDIVTPFSWSILEPITNIGFRRFLYKIGVKNYPTAGLFGLYAGKVYLNRTAFRQLLQRFYLNDPEKKSAEKRKMLRSLFAVVRLGFYSVLLPGRIKRFRLGHRRQYESLRFQPGLKAEESLLAVQKQLQTHEDTMALHISCTIIAELYYQFLSNMCRKWFAADETITADALLSGLHAAESAQSGRALWKITQLVNKSDALQRLFIRTDPDVLREKLSLSAEGKTVLGAIDTFLEEYGHGALHEFELYYPRWREDDRYIFTTLKNYIIQGHDFDAQQFQTEQKRLLTGKAALQKLGFIRKFVLRFILWQTGKFSTERENLKQDFIRLHSELKKHLLRIGDFLEQKNIIAEKDDILFLKLEEIEALILNSLQKESLQDVVAARKQERERYCETEHPKQLRQWGNDFYPMETGRDEDGKRLTGTGCSAGIAEGKVNIISEAESYQSFGKGEILVAKSVNPGWTPLFVLAGAVVTEIGGALSHGAIIAREYGIPMVTAVPGITEKLKSGMRVRVNGYTGEVLILETIEQV